MPLHQGQIRYLRAVQTSKYRKFILVPANRYGKSTLISCLQIWHLFYKFGIAPGNRETWFKAEYRTANIAPHSSLTEPVFKTIGQILTSRFPIRTTDGRIVTNKCLIEWFYLPNRTHNQPPFKQFFANNSYIEHRSLSQDQGDSLQGKPYGIITYDEGGRSLHLQEELSANIMPRLFDWGGTFHLLSTPDQNSPSILYHYQLYQEGKQGMNQTYTQEGSLRENQFFAADQIQEQYDLFQDDPLAPQILEGQFVFGGDNLFNAQDILDAQDPRLNDGVLYIEGRKYVVGTDTAMGSDEMVHTVLDVTDLKIRKDASGLWNIEGQAELVRQKASKGNSKSPQQHLNDFIDLAHSYKGERLSPHVLETWNGESANFYQSLPYDLQAVTRCYGSWQPEHRTTDNKNTAKPKNQSIKKADILIALQKLLSAKAIKIPDTPELTQQLSIYKLDDGNIPTDRVMSLALAAWLASETNAFQTEIKWVTF